MIFEFENLGSIKKAELEVGNLTVICGKNNTGKTYLTYAVWGMLARRLSGVTKNPNRLPEAKKKITDQLINNRNATIDLKDFENSFKDAVIKYIKGISPQLHRIFDVDKSFFKNTNISLKKLVVDYNKEISVSISGHRINYRYEKNKDSSIINFRVSDSTKIEESDIEVVLSWLILDFLPLPFLISAQRDAIHLFGNAINDYARDKIRMLRNDNKENNFIRYALPLEENIRFVSNLSQISSQISFFYDTPLFTEIEEILGVEYDIFHESFTIKDKEGNITPAHLASTSVRALADLHFYLKHRAQKNDLLMIDEPELSLHPENQIKIARLIVKLVNAGLKVWITTHSDYIIKELNNCLMLSNKRIKNKKKLMKDLGYKDNEILTPDDLKMYIAADGTLEKVAYDDFGVLKSAFDEAMITQNRNSNTIAEYISQKK